LRTVLVLLTFVVMLYPFVMLAQRALTSSGAVGRVFNTPGIAETFANTAVLAVACVLVAAPVGIGLAWCSASLGVGRLGTLALLLGTIPIMMPAIAAVIGWQFLLSPTIGYVNQILRGIFPGVWDDGPFDVYSLPMIILVTSMYLVSFVFTFVSTALRDLDGGLEDAARVFGSSWIGAQFRIVAQLIRPALIYSLVIILLLALGQFTAPLLLGKSSGINVVTTEIFKSIANYPGDYGVAAVLTIPVLIFAVFVLMFQRRAVGTLSRYSSTSKGGIKKVVRRRWPIFPILAFALFVTIPPIFGLIWVALAPFWSGTLSTRGFGFNHIWGVLSDDLVLNSIVTTFQLAFFGVLGCLVVAVLVGLYLHHGSGRIAKALDIVVSLPLTLPAIAMGVAVFFAYGVGPVNLYGTRAVIAIAWIAMFLPHAVRLVLAGLSQMGSQLEPAARIAGSTATGAMIRVVLPMLRGSLTSAAFLVFILMIHEFAAVALLAVPGTDVLSTTLYNFWEAGTYAQVATMGLIMVAVSAVGVVLIQKIGGGAKWQR
jgi:iron(III) transport system permease protein